MKMAVKDRFAYTFEFQVERFWGRFWFRIFGYGLQIQFLTPRLRPPGLLE